MKRKRKRKIKIKTKYENVMKNREILRQIDRERERQKQKYKLEKVEKFSYKIF